MNKIILFFFILLSLIISPVYGATRFYLPSTGAAEVSPAFHVDWASTAEADRLKCVTTRIESDMIDKAIAVIKVASVANRQYVSASLEAQEISGSVSGEVRGFETSPPNNAFSAVIIRVVSNDGSTFRGTLLDMTSGGTEYSTAPLQNRETPPASGLTPVTAQAGDRIVIEIGMTKLETKSGAETQNFGDNHSLDLAVGDNTDNDVHNPWIEFSQTLSFQVPIVRKVILINF